MPDRVFQTLDLWRQLPNYQMERRIDIFFGYYLKEIVEDYLSNRNGKPITLQNTIIPELPIRKSLVSEDDSNRSVKVDYALFPEQPGAVIFLELKTAQASRNCKQDEYLSEIEGKPFVSVLEGLKRIFLETDQRRKYLLLFQQLGKAGYVKLPDDLECSLAAGSRKTKSLIGEIEILESDAEINVIYILPRQDLERPGDHVISFQEISDFLGKRTNDAMATEFARYLLRWKEGP